MSWGAFTGLNCSRPTIHISLFFAAHYYISASVCEQKITYQLFGGAEYPRNVPVRAYCDSGDRGSFCNEGSNARKYGAQELLNEDNIGNIGSIPFEVLTASIEDLGGQM